MSREKAIFDHVTNVIRQTVYYVPRNYKTVGGMWTVDTYKKGDMTVQIMDEGWTIKLITPNVIAVESGSNFEIEKGTISDFEKVLESVS